MKAKLVKDFLNEQYDNSEEISKWRIPQEEWAAFEEAGNNAMKVIDSEEKWETVEEIFDQLDKPLKEAIIWGLGTMENEKFMTEVLNSLRSLERFYGTEPRAALYLATKLLKDATQMFEGVNEGLQSDFEIQRNKDKDEKPQFTKGHITGSPLDNWYEKPKAFHRKLKPLPKRRSLSWTQIDDIKRDIDDINDEINILNSNFEDGPEWEIEEFFAEMGFAASDIVNSGISDKDKIKELTKLGIKDPEDIIATYHYYYPAYDSSRDKERKETEKEIEKLKAKREKLLAKLNN